LESFKLDKCLEQQTLTNNYNRKAIDGIYNPFSISINTGVIVANLFNKSIDE